MTDMDDENPSGAAAERFEISKQVQHAAYFSFENLKASEEGVRIVFGGVETCDPSYEINRPGYPLHCLEVVVQGSGELHLDGVKHGLRPGSAILYGPKIPCRIVTSPRDPLRKYFIAFDRCDDWGADDVATSESGFFQTVPEDEIITLAEMLFREGRSGLGSAAPLCHHFLAIMLARLNRSRSLQRQQGERAWRVFEHCREAIDRHFLELGNLGDLAQLVELDVAYICRLFKRYHDTTPYQYLQRKKTDFALHLLRTQDCTVSEAASRSSFEDPFHFSRVFRRHHGFAPSHFRRRSF